LTRIQNNLKETLQVCLRAKRALERSEHTKTDALQPGNAAPPQLPAPAQANARTEELSSVDEQRKFQRLGPIDLREVRACDLDLLCRKLMDAPM
jgi:hypothetical protein